MSAVDLIRTAQDNTYAGRVALIQLKVAQNVASEDPGTANHQARVDYAYVVIRGAENPKMVAAHINSANPVIAAAIEAQPDLLGANVPDSDLEFAMATIWDSRSLAFAAASVARTA